MLRRRRISATSCFVSKTGCVITYCAPAATFRSSRGDLRIQVFRAGLNVQPITNREGDLDDFADVIEPFIQPL